MLIGVTFYNSCTNIKLLLGGFGDFGGYVSDWMVKQGARNLVLVTTEVGAENQPSFKSFNEKWKSLNCSVSIAKANDFSLRNCESIVQNVTKLGPVGGIFDFTEFKVSYQVHILSIVPQC